MPPKKRNASTLQGAKPSTIKKFLIQELGEDYVIKVVIDQRKCEFQCQIVEGADEKKKAKFLETWPMYFIVMTKEDLAKVNAATH